MKCDVVLIYKKIFCLPRLGILKFKFGDKKLIIFSFVFSAKG
jgi:hypothetical protein